ncbi:MAG: GNAT family N-acetyltransferase [Frankiaceae bacterium]
MEPVIEPVTVRALTAADDPGRLRDLRLEMLADAPLAYLERIEDARRHPLSYWTERVHRYAGGVDRQLYVAEAGNGAWVAQAGGYLDRSGLAYLVSVYVRPAHRGRGLLERLAAPVFDWATARGSTEIRLEVARENARAVAAYRRLGFVPTGRSQPHPLYPRRSVEIEMSRPL